MIFTKIKQRNVKSVLAAIFMSGHEIQYEGVSLPQRGKMNFVGAGVTVTDDPANDQTDVTITSGGGGTPGRRILYKNNVSSSLTGTTSETKMDSFIIPAGTIQANDILLINVFTSKSGAAGTLTIRARINTTGNQASGTIWMLASSVAANLWFRAERHLLFKNSLLSQTALNNTLSASSDYGGQNITPSNLAEDFSVDQNIVLNFSNSSAADTTSLLSWYVELIR